TTFLDDLLLRREIEQRAGGGNSLVIHDVEFRFGEWRGHFVFYNLDPGAVTGDHAIGLFDCTDAANIDTNAGVKFQRLAARCRLRIPEHDADFFTNLVGENAAGPRLRNQGSEFAQRRAHQTRLRAYGGIANFALQFGPCHQRGDRIDHDDIKRIRADERFTDTQGFFPRARLRDQQVVKINTKLLRIPLIQRVFDVDERSEAATFLRLRDHGQRKRS